MDLLLFTYLTSKCVGSMKDIHYYNVAAIQINTDAVQIAERHIYTLSNCSSAANNLGCNVFSVILHLFPSKPVILPKQPLLSDTVFVGEMLHPLNAGLQDADFEEDTTRRPCFMDKFLCWKQEIQNKKNRPKQPMRTVVLGDMELIGLLCFDRERMLL